MGMNQKDFMRIMRCAAEAGISDINLVAGEPVFWRRNGIWSPLREYKPTDEDIYQVFCQLVQKEAWDELLQQKAINVAWAMEKWRYRIHAYYKMGKIAFAVRVLPQMIPSFAALGQAAVLQQFLTYRQGLVLVTGATGAGKTTSVAAFLEALNQQESLHILTLEDPVEFIYSKSRSLISQREAGRDFATFGDAMEQAMRESPDVIMVSELRDSKTVQAVLNAAVTGCLVVATMHAGSVTEAIERIISMVPEAQQALGKSLLASGLIGVCTQQLLLGKGGSRYCAVECLKNNEAVSNIIRSSRYEQLKNVMQSGGIDGMQTMEKAVAKLRGNLIQRRDERLVSIG